MPRQTAQEASKTPNMVSNILVKATRLAALLKWAGGGTLWSAAARSKSEGVRTLAGPRAGGVLFGLRAREA
eukprot:910237-Pyramimonas_sp.AAC.1